MNRRPFLIVASTAVATILLAGTALASGRITVKEIGAFEVGNVVGFPPGHTFTSAAAPGTLVVTPRHERGLQHRGPLRDLPRGAGG